MKSPTKTVRYEFSNGIIKARLTGDGKYLLDSENIISNATGCTRRTLDREGETWVELYKAGTTIVFASQLLDALLDTCGLTPRLYETHNIKDLSTSVLKLKLICSTYLANTCADDSVVYSARRFNKAACAELEARSRV